MARSGSSHAALEEARVPRLEGKRRDLRALVDRERWLDMLAELRLAAWHVRHGVEVELGSTKNPNPDLVLPAYGLGLEMTRRARGGLADLRRAVREGTRSWTPRPKPHILVTGQPLSIRRTVLNQITEAVSAALQAGEEEVHVVLRPAAGDRPAMTARISLFGGISVIPQIKYHTAAADLTVTMADIEQLVQDCLDDPRKQAQGAAMTSLLMIDASRLSDTLWLRSPAAWCLRLAVLVAQSHAFVGVGLVAWPVDSAPRAAIGLRQLLPDEATRIRSWASVMNLEISGDA